MKTSTFSSTKAEETMLRPQRVTILLTLRTGIRAVLLAAQRPVTVEVLKASHFAPVQTLKE